MDVPVECLCQHKIRKNVAVTPKSSGATEELQDITECPICTETYTDPRMLPCIHSFCLQCLERVGVSLNRKPGDSFPCPLCRKEFNIPSSGLSALPRNIFIGHLVNILQEKALSGRNIRPTCDHYESKRGEPLGKEAISRAQRKKNLFEQCYREQKQCGLTKGHPMASCVRSVFKENIQEQSEIQRCKRHIHKKLDLYCLDCKSVICTSCYAEGHEHHNIEHVYKVANKVTAEIQGYTDEMNSFLKQVNTRGQRVDEEKMEFRRKLENAEEMIWKRSKSLKDLIEKHTKTLLADLKSIQEKMLKEFETYKDELERQMTAAESFKTYCNEIRFAQSPVAACYSIVDVRAKADEILQFRKSEMLRKDRVVEVLLIHSELEDFIKTKCSNLIGKVEDKSFETVTDNSGSSEVQSKISAKFTGKLDIDYRRVFGVTTVQNYICILCQSPNGILVYDYQAPYVLKKEIAMKTIKRPFDIASSVKSGSLYIAADNIWKLHVQDFKMITWLCCTVKPRKLSVSRQGIILLVNSDCSLTLHTEDSKLISKIQLPPDIRQPMHACETSVGNIVVCYKDGKSLGLCEVDRNGLVLHRFLSKEGLPIHGPLHLVLDSDNRAFVADFSNNRVIVFDSKFSELNVLLTEVKDEIFGPLGICYDRDKQQLMVAHGAGLDGATQVFIYSLTTGPLTAMFNGPMMDT